MATATLDQTAHDTLSPHAARTPILIVDDYLIDRRLAGGIVEKIPGLRAICVEDGDQALIAIERERPAAVLTDLQMPGIDGLALVVAIRNRYPTIPVVLMTAFGSEDVAMRALRAGAANYVPKKTLAQDLAATLRQVLNVTVVGQHRQRLRGAMRTRSSSYCLENDPDLVMSLIGTLQEELDRMGLGDESARMRISVALQEALTNALYHGNLEVSSDLRQDDERVFHKEANRRRMLEPFRSRRIHVQARLDRDEVAFVIRDEGPGFDTSALDRPIEPEDLIRIGGRGMLLIRTFMDEVRHNATGNEITLIKRGVSRPDC